ncbi:hypothetical protein LQ327_32295 [Actinomycetospora endophytica]|uniref:FtsK domain-containing protein n=1 Tax=Actinomycetospora endophytica TaxID=2291215 RepID=A0ABS8PIF8_9PSEU|nr:FtsK/SpoIIIE domain-containing protein [Actinomycetospora endophytica]MCD2198063.1 hypothetical protein [Actinomycetospora endophytica]
MRETWTARMWRGQTIRTRSDVVRTEHIPYRPAPLTYSLAALRWSLWTVGMLAWGAIYIPAAGAALALLVLGGLLAGSWGLVAAAVLASLAGRLWARFWPVHWQRWGIGRAHRFWRRLRYRWSWDDVLAASGVKATDARHNISVPRLLWVSLGEHADALHVQLCAGITPATLAAQTDALASEWCALEVRVQAHPWRPGWVLLRVVYRDVLADDPAATAGPTDFRWLDVGRCEDGRRWWLRLMGTHILIAGLTGAGKSGLVAGIVKGLCPAIADGRVRLIGIDPKGGMEYRMYSELFYMLAYGTDDALVAALEAAADLMAERANQFGGRIRKLLRPTTTWPLYVLLVDEIAALTSFIANRELKERASAALNRMLTQGRAPGVVVVGCIQDPRKEVLPMRDRFGYRVGLRQDSPDEVRMTLSETAYDRGARCDLIPEDCPGIGYVIDDDGARREPVKVRADWVPDAELIWLAAQYPAPTQVDVPPLAAKNRTPVRATREDKGRAA